MPILPALKPADVTKALGRAGFSFARQKGSHCIYVKGHIYKSEGVRPTHYTSQRSRRGRKFAAHPIVPESL